MFATGVLAQSSAAQKSLGDCATRSAEVPKCGTPNQPPAPAVPTILPYGYLYDMNLMVYLAAASGRGRGKFEQQGSCPGSASVTWVSASECGAGTCGDDWNTSHPLMVPRCAGGGTLRHFKRSSVMHCLRQLSSISGKPRYRLLMGGVSNALHIYRALQDDDSLEPWERERSRKAHPSCPPLPTVRLRAFAPHVLVRHASAPFEHVQR